MTELDYMDDLAIDPHNLVEEWLRQPVTYMKYAEGLAGAQQTRDKAKEHLNVERARADKDIREDPAAYGLPKATEASVSNAIPEHPGYRKALGEFNDSVHECNILSASVSAFDQKKKSLENITTLLMGGYFSVPKESGDIEAGKRMADTGRDVASAKQREGLNRTRRKRS